MEKQITTWLEASWKQEIIFIIKANHNETDFGAKSKSKSIESSKNVFWVTSKKPEFFSWTFEGARPKMLKAPFLRLLSDIFYENTDF